MSNKFKCLAFFIIILLQLSIVAYLFFDFDKVASIIYFLSHWSQSHPFLSLLLLSLLDIVCVAVLLPLPILNFVLNYTSISLFSPFPGVFIGFSLSFFSTSIGCTLSFLIARYLIASQIQSFVNKRYAPLQAIFKAVESEGFKTVLLVRLAFFPNLVVNYGFAITKITVKDFIIGTLGLIPKIAIGVYVAATVESLTSRPTGTTWVEKVLLVCGVVLAVFVAVGIGFKAKKELEKLKQEQEYREMDEFKP